MAEIVPSILEETIERFASKQSAVFKFPGLNRIQIDFADGVFTDRKLIPPSDLDLLNPIYHWEAHLMVQRPEEYLFDCKIAGFSTIIVHCEVFSNQQQAERLAQEIRKLKMTPAIAVKLDTDLEKLKPLVRFYDQVLFLAVHPGFQGGQFAENTYSRVKTLRSWGVNVKIEVDGGVKLEQVERLVQEQVDYIVVGSALFDMSGNILSPTENYERFDSAARK